MNNQQQSNQKEQPKHNPNPDFSNYDLSAVEDRFKTIFAAFLKFGNDYIRDGFSNGEYLRRDMRQMFYLFFGGFFVAVSTYYNAKETMPKAERKRFIEDLETQVNDLAAFFHETFGGFPKDKGKPKSDIHNAFKTRSPRILVGQLVEAFERVKGEGITLEQAFADIAAKNKINKEGDLFERIDKAAKEAADNLKSDIKTGAFEEKIEAFKKLFGAYNEVIK